LDTPGTVSYDFPASFRIIVLRKTLSKILERLMIVRLSAIAPSKIMLPPKQCGSLPALSASDTCLSLAHDVRTLQGSNSRSPASSTISRQASTTSTPPPSWPLSWPEILPPIWSIRSYPSCPKGRAPWTSKAPPTSQHQSQSAPHKDPQFPLSSSSSTSPLYTRQYPGA